MDAQAVASTSALPAEERQIAIRLSTKDAAFSIPATKFLVPASWRRFHLSELINKVLENCKCSTSDLEATRPRLNGKARAWVWGFALFRRKLARITTSTP